MSTLDALRWDSGHPTILETDWNRLLRLLENGGVVKTASYIIWTDGTTILAVNGTTGVVDYQGAVASTVIQSAIDGLAAVDGGLISFRQGTYTLTASLTIITENISLRGENRGNTIIDGDALGDYAIKIGNGVVDINPGPRISSLFVKGGIEVRGHNTAGTDLGVHSIWFQDLRLETTWGFGVRILNFHTQPSTIRDCVIANCEMGGIYITGDIEGVVIANNNFGANKLNDIRIDREAYGRPRDIVIENNVFEHFAVGTAGRAVYLYGVDSVWVIKNHINDTYDATLDAILVTGNTADSAWWSTRCFINDNWIWQDDVAKIRHGINLDGVMRSIVSRNRILLAGNFSIVTSEDTHSIQVESNEGVITLSIEGYPNYVRGNRGFNPVGVIASPFDVVNDVVGVPAGGTASPIASTDYTVIGVDLIISSTDSGNNNCAIVIKDPTGNTINPAVLSTLDAYFIPIGYQVNWGAFTGVAPTCVVSGN